MSHHLGCHWIRVHPDSVDFDHVARMQYRSAKTFEWMHGDKNFCNELLAALPQDAYILARNHPRSEQKEDMFRDPIATGIRHANEWAADIREGRCHLPVERTYCLGINEPDATAGDRSAIDRYTAAFLDRLRQHGLRGGAFNFSTGHPRTKDGTPHTAPDYTVFEMAHQAIVRGNHIGVMHIYGTAQVPCAPGHYDRIKSCPWQDVQWVVGECGIDEHVIGGGEHRGWQYSLGGDANRYCDWLDALIMGVSDSRIHSWQIFTYDFSQPWGTFDIKPARSVMESWNWQHDSVTPAPPLPLPDPLAKGKVIAPAGLNVRSGPGVNYQIVRAIPHGAEVNIYESETDAVGALWHMIGHNEWVHSRWIEIEAEEPEPLPSGDKWQRSIDFVLRWEGGYQNLPHDDGNWTGCKQGIGENKGTNFGISACSYPTLDIRNLTKEQAKEIYRKDYWQKSGADKFEWPLCLLVLDTAVLHGVGAATSWLKEVGPNPYEFASKRLYVYVKSDKWDFWGNAWTRRVADLLAEMG